jgi:hypothetical protein
VTRILGIHGIGNFQAGLQPSSASQLLGRRWQAALMRALTSRAIIDVRVAYYADCLVQGHAQGNDELEYLAPSAKQLVMAWVEALGAPREVAQGRLGAPVRQAADWIATKFGFDCRSVHVIVARFAAEVDRYLNLPDCRAAARERVAAQLREHAPLIVIAHSLGSVVAYEALFGAQQPPLDLLVTVGSPLGMPGLIFDKLMPAPVNGFGEKPPNVDRWVNIADPADFIAIPRHMRLRFHGITGDIEASIGSLHFHSSFAYLSCSAMAGLLAAYLNPA